jgi:hypothetical protein
MFRCVTEFTINIHQWEQAFIIPIHDPLYAILVFDVYETRPLRDRRIGAHTTMTSCLYEHSEIDHISAGTAVVPVRNLTQGVEHREWWPLDSGGEILVGLMSVDFGYLTYFDEGRHFTLWSQHYISRDVGTSSPNYASAAVSAAPHAPRARRLDSIDDVAGTSCACCLMLVSLRPGSSYSRVFFFLYRITSIDPCGSRSLEGGRRVPTIVRLSRAAPAGVCVCAASASGCGLWPIDAHDQLHGKAAVARGEEAAQEREMGKAAERDR